MELRHLRYFVAVAEELHFSRAAIRLNISQSPLSQQIAGLEHELGVRLFDRDRRTVELTKAGEVFLQRARYILAESASSVLEVRRVDRGFAGQIGIGFVSAVMLSMLGGYLREFRENLPGVDVVLRQGRSDEQCTALINKKIDLGFVDVTFNERLPTIDTSILDVRPALDFRLMLCTSTDHPLADRECISALDLKNLPFITLARNSYPTSCDTLYQLCERHGFSPLIHQEVESMPVVVALAAAGYGVALVPISDVAPALAPDIRLIALEEDPSATVFMISRANDKSKLIKQFREICSDRYSRSS